MPERAPAGCVTQQGLVTALREVGYADCDETTVRNWVRDGMPVAKKAERRGSSTFYNLDDVGAWLLEREQNKRVPWTAPGKTTISARERLLEIKAEREQMRLDRERGALVPVAEVQAQLQREYAALSDRLLKIPLAISDPALRRKIETAIRNCLNEFANQTNDSTEPAGDPVIPIGARKTGSA